MLCPRSNSVEIIFSVEHSRNIDGLLGRVGRNLLSLGPHGRNLPFLVDPVETKSQTSSREVSPLLFWDAQCRAINLVAQNCNIPILVAIIATYLWVVQCRANNSVAQSRIISVLGCAKLRKLSFVVQSATYSVWVAMVATYLFWVAQSSKIPNLGRAKSQHT